MCLKRSFGTEIVVLLVITLSVCLLSCGDVELDIDQKQTEEPLKFIEFVLFPTAPYVDKSYIEKVPPEEVVVGQIDFDTEKEEIQRVYTAFIRAYVNKDMTTLEKTFDITQSIEYGTTTGIIYGWNDVKILYSSKLAERGRGLPEQSGLETDRFLHPPSKCECTLEGSKCKRDPCSTTTWRLTHVTTPPGIFYLTKKSGEWRIHQIDGSKYFADEDLQSAITVSDARNQFSFYKDAVATRLKRVLKSSRVPRRIRCGSKPHLPGPGAEAVIFS